MTVTFRSLVPESLVQALVDQGHITAREVQRALDATTRTGAPIERVILELGLVPEDLLFRTLADLVGLPFLPADGSVSPLAEGLGLATDYLLRAELLPFAEAEDGSLLVALSDPRALDRVKDLGFHLQRSVTPCLTSPSTLRRALTPQVREVDEVRGGAAEGDVDRLRAMANDGPIVRQVNHIIAEAVALRASDIHIEAENHGARVRFRIDGILRAFGSVAEADRPAVTSRIKVMANLNISEKRRPQDGRAAIAVRGRNIDLRISTLPSQFGESIVMRLLDRNRLQLDWAELGFSSARATEIRQILTSPSGIFLIAGPTGSGKTTTLYTALAELNATESKIVTVEDPIEYSIPGITQVQVEPDIDMTFARALRALLRQDPDTIMIGEIRDQETAEIAVRAALVGRLVLSTIHTNSSIAAVARMVDLGVPGYLLAATLRGVLSQRLARKTCAVCLGQGCASCRDTGYQGRTVISEFLRISTEVAAGVGDGKDQVQLLAAARQAGFRQLSEEALDLVNRQILTKQEVLRALGSSDG